MSRGILARAAAKATREAAEWNGRYPVGTRVRYWPGVREGDGVAGHTRSVAWEVCGTAVVSCTGRAGGIALSHVDPLPEHWVALGRDRSPIAGADVIGADEQARAALVERLGPSSMAEWDDCGRPVCREGEWIERRRSWREEREVSG